MLLQELWQAMLSGPGVQTFYEGGECAGIIFERMPPRDTKKTPPDQRTRRMSLPHIMLPDLNRVSSMT